MAFPTGWGRKCALVIQASKVDANLTDFPVLLTKDTLPSEMFDADGSYPALSGGGDIRFSSDSAGNTQLACEPVTFTIDNNPANGVAEIWVKVPSVSSSTNTTIYVWYNKSGESQPAPDSTYGSENVWDSNFKMVQHMNEDPSGSAPQMIDSTSNDNDGTSVGSMTSGDLVSAKIGKGLDFDGSDDGIDCGDMTVEGTDLTLSAWIDVDNVNLDQRMIVGKYSGNGAGTDSLFFRVQTDGSLEFWTEDSVGANGYKRTAASIISVDTQYYVVLVYDYSGDDASHYLNGVLKPNSQLDDTLTKIANTVTPLVIGKRGVYAGDWMDGLIDEVHISNISRSVSWTKAEYNNQDDPSTFVIEGTPEAGGGISMPIIIHHILRH